MEADPAMETNMSNFVRRLRRQLGMTQEEFAHALGITVGTVNRWENQRFRPSKLARATILEFARRHGINLEIPGSENGAPSADESNPIH
jgi:DNA-binding transcriptional regulator YiaG